MSFIDSFWSPGYQDGLNALYNKLAQGIVENTEVLALAAARADMEEQYGQRLRDVPNSFGPKRAGFARDDGASMRRAYDGILEEMSREGGHHIQVSQNIRKMVIEPFSRWSDEHKKRIHYSRDLMTKKTKQYERELAEVHKAQKRYFNKCRLLEDYRDAEAEDSSVNDVTRPSSPAQSEKQVDTSSVVSPPSQTGSEEPAITSEELVLNGKVYDIVEAQKFIAKMLDEIPQSNLKVSILGTYANVSTGSDITQWLQKNTFESEIGVGDAEKIGQDLINNGILRLVAQVGSKFANSSVMSYQWRPRAFEFAGISHFEPSGFDSIIGGTFGESIQETWSGYVTSRSSSVSDEKVGERLSHEVRELDQRYRKNVTILDNVRTELEEVMVDHLKFMERCELDRLKALKAVMLDFLAALSNVVPSIQASVDKLLLYQETVNPVTDLRYIIESYRTGSFAPTVTVYDNYYSSAEGNIFGMDLELRSRGDRKHVPYIVSSILIYLDSVYPRLENDTVRLGLWTVDVSLKQTHALRREINTNTSFDKAILTKFDTPVVVSVLKLYFLELPDSIIPSQHYDIFKAVYSKHGGPNGKEARFNAVQNTLAQLRVSNIATLDAVTAHLKRLTTIAKASEDDIQNIARELGSCLLHPKQENALTFNDTFPTQLFRDLLDDRDRMFKELKRAAQPTPAREDSVKITRRESVEDRVSRIAQRLAKTNLRSTSDSPGTPETTEHDHLPPQPLETAEEESGSEYHST